jgi:hypothetical protein
LGMNDVPGAHTNPWCLSILALSERYYCSEQYLKAAEMIGLSINRGGIDWLITSILH